MAICESCLNHKGREIPGQQMAICKSCLSKQSQPMKKCGWCSKLVTRAEFNGPKHAECRRALKAEGEA